eukprot:559741-Pleurochrysis_carterae.AAC.3
MKVVRGTYRLVVYRDPHEGVSSVMRCDAMPMLSLSPAYCRCRSLLYLWTLIAPALCPNRDFGV